MFIINSIKSLWYKFRGYKQITNYEKTLKSRQEVIEFLKSVKSITNKVDAITRLRRN